MARAGDASGFGQVAVRSPRPEEAARWRRLGARLLRAKAPLAGAVILFGMALVALLAGQLAPDDPLRLNVVERLTPPTRAHWLGTDEYGRDLLSRVIHGARISLRIGLLVVTGSISLGLAVGLLTGYFPRLDGPIMRVMDGLQAFPSILLAIAVVAALGPREVNTAIALVVVQMPRDARLVRGSVLATTGQAYVEAARGLGVPDLGILARHVLPNCLPPLTVQATFTFAFAILAEASLSFLGVGTPPPAPSWGNILAEARVVIREAPWMSFFPGVAIAATVMGLNLFGDWLRDALDPRLRSL